MFKGSGSGEWMGIHCLKEEDYMSKRLSSPSVPPISSATIESNQTASELGAASPIPSGVSIEQVNGLIASVASALGSLYQAPVYRHTPPPL